MTRWILTLLVVLAGAAWWFSDDGQPAKGKAGMQAVALQRPEPEGALAPGQRAKSGGSGRQAARQALAGKPGGGPGPRGPAGTVADLDRVLARTSELRAKGQPDAAREVLAQAMRSTENGANEIQVGRLALLAAAEEPDPLTRRQLLGRALASHAVRGEEWHSVGASLVQLAGNPQASLYPAIDSFRYTVAPGDSLWKLCNRTLTDQAGVALEPGLLRLVNSMDSDTIRAGQVLVIPKQPLRLEIDRTEHGLAVWLGDVAIAAYRIGLGKEDRTPRGQFTIEVKQKNPDWYPPTGRRIPYGDPENVLGTRWLGFANEPNAMGYGIHGTDQPGSIGLNESQGCVRMRNDEVEQLFELVPRGTTVSIP